MRLMLQAQHAQPARQPDRPRRRLSQRLPAQERHQQRPLKHQKVLPLQSPQKRGGHQCQCGENVRNECGSVTTISSHFCIHRDHESVRSCHLSPGCGGLKRGGKNHQKRTHPRAPVVQLPRQRRQEIPRRRQNVRDERGLLETAAGQSASAAAGSKQRLRRLPVPRQQSAGQASASATAAGKSAESAASSASTATTKAGEATEQASAAARSASAAKTSETNAKASETSAESLKTAAASSASSAASSASSASASKDEATRQASAAKGSATTASTKATEAAGSATAAAQSKSTAESAATRAETAAKRAEDIASAVAFEDASTTKRG